MENDRSVNVRVNDRGPYVKDRILDLTRTAAEKLGYVQKGMARVTYEILNDQSPIIAKDTATVAPLPERLLTITEVDTSQKLGYGIKIASYEDSKFAFTISHDMKARFNLSCYIQTVKLTRGFLYRIFVGNFSSKEGAEDLRGQLKKNYPECYVISYENFR